MSTGKRFEEDFYKSFASENQDRILRLYDTTNGFAGVANPCDFVYYAFPLIGFFELKSVQGKSLPFANITERQWKGLSARSKITGVVAAVLVQFREHQEGYLLPIQLLEWVESTGRASINIEMARKYGMPLHLQYSRTRCKICPHQFMENFLSYDVGVSYE